MNTNSENAPKILEEFFQDEIDFYLSREHNLTLVNFNIGTKGTIKQEINKDWIQTITPVFFDPTYCKIFYYIDKEYEAIDFKNNYLETWIKQIRTYKTLDNDKLCDFRFSKKYQNIETCINDRFNIIIHKVGFNLKSAYDAHRLHENIIKHNLELDVCFKSIPQFKFWKLLYEIIYILKLKQNSTIFINNRVCTNSKFYINEATPKPKFVNAYVGYHFEYISELIYIVKHIEDSINNIDISPILFRIEESEESKSKLVNFNQLGYNKYSLDGIWVV